MLNNSFFYQQNSLRDCEIYRKYNLLFSCIQKTQNSEQNFVPFGVAGILSETDPKN